MKIIIDRDSVCMGDDFGHQLTIECSDDETIESIMNKILKSKFFPVENLNHIVKKWNTIINNEIILNFYPTENRIEYLIDKNYNIANLENLNIYFKAIRESYTSSKRTPKDYFLLILFICLLCFNIAIVILPIFLFFFYTNNDYDTCLDTGFCKSGIEINTEYGKVKIDKTNCLKYKWKWYEKENACFVNN